MSENGPSNQRCGHNYYPARLCPLCKVESSLAPAPGSTSRLAAAIESAKRKAVDELNALDWHEGDLRKMNIIERAIRGVIAEMLNDKLRDAAT